MTKSKALSLQPVTEADYAEVVELINASDRSFVGHNIVTLNVFVTDLNTLDLNPATDTCVVRASDGEPMAYAEFWAGAEPHVRMFGFVRIHPQHKCEGAGTAISRWLESRAMQELAKAPEGLRVTLGMRAYAVQPNARAFLERCGYKHVRSNYRMTIGLNGSIPEPVFPAGIVLRIIQPDEADLRRALQAEQEAFLDHYGVIPELFDTYFERRKNMLLHDETVDLSACFMALDGEQVAGVDFNAISLADDQETGWVGTLSVRRPWRKQGLGLALLRNAFREMHQRGRKRVGLYVDAENLTGALGLYQQAGMHVQYETRYFEKELRPGKDIANIG
ncbi:MAG: GNAT family N-acetyltransferase [Bellilinea sp.]